jgi:hypothetical protein
LEAAREIMTLTQSGAFDDYLKTKIQVRIIEAITAAIGAGGQAVEKPEVGSPAWKAERERTTGICSWCDGSGYVPTRDLHDEISRQRCPRCGGTVAHPVQPGWRQGHVEIAHDGFAGDIIGHYVTREGKRGVVVQQDGTRVVHVYGEKWLTGGGESTLKAFSHPVQPAPSTPEGWRPDCATEGCGKPASVHFIRGDIGSYYCHACYLKVQALPASPKQETNASKGGLSE